MSYLIAAYTVIMIAIFGYVFLIFYRQRRLKGEIDFLKKKVEATEEDFDILDQTDSEFDNTRERRETKNANISVPNRVPEAP